MRRSWLAFVILLSSSLLDVKLLATQPVSLIFWLFQLSHNISNGVAKREIYSFFKSFFIWEQCE
ncbi:hypothetical protein CUMW_183450 [Citrus unshiu]|uniref:Secreted protein n=1 Tax=Citrus unshiu TaxID=55188 RepID=A0A2H5Q003_CITUN|nr:hypothetical protein CUMW_183450 [Citrus unshiu]GAY57960.1 hypothetical protein CUMW_183450 [Citrus unshiu]